MFLGLQHFKRVQFHHVSSTQWNDLDDSHITRYQLQWWVMHGFIQSLAESDAERCWMSVLSGNLWHVPGLGPGNLGTWEGSELAQVTPGLCMSRWLQNIYISSTEILWDSIFARNSWKALELWPRFGLFPHPMFMSKIYFWKCHFFIGGLRLYFLRTQCSSDDLPQLSVFEAFFVSMPCCCRLDLGFVSASSTWEGTEIRDEHNIETMHYIILSYWIVKIYVKYNVDSVETRVL